MGKRQIKRRLGPRRSASVRIGLTQRQAEAALREAITQTNTERLPEAQLTLTQATGRYLDHGERVLGRKPSTAQDYRSITRRHFSPFFSDWTLERIDTNLISDYAAAKRAEGLALKTVANHLRLLHAIFSHAVKRGWTQQNPAAAVDLPRKSEGSTDIRFLTSEELEALLAAVADDAFAATDRVLYLTAALTGLRQGELVALRWRDVDRSAGLVRVRRSFTRGQFGAPKSHRSSRAVPMADAYRTR